MKDELTVSFPKMLLPRGDIQVEFTGKNLTKFGGISLLRKFLIQLRVKEELKSAVTIEKRESKFSVGQILICLLYAVTLDMKRQNDTLMLRLDKVFQKIAGLDDYPV